MSLLDLDFSDSAESSVEPTRGLLSASNMQNFANDAAFVTAKGSAAAVGDMYFNTTSVIGRLHNGTNFVDQVDVSTVQTITDKAVSDATNNIVDDGDPTKRLNFSLGGATTSTRTTLVASQTADRSLTLPDLTDTLVSRTSTDVLTNKSLSDSTTSIVDNADNTKVAKFEASGITTATTRTMTIPDADLTLVGTTTAQVLTSKDIDGGTASNSNRLTVPSNTTVNLNALTRKEATLVYSTDDDKLLVDDGTTLNEVGEAASGVTGLINHITNPDFETNTSGWATYADAAGTDPVDGTGGSPTVTLTRTNIGSEVLRGTGSGELAKDAANRQGEGVSFDFTLPNADQGKQIEITFDFAVSGGFVVGDSSDVRVWIYDIDAAGLIDPDVKTIDLTEGTFATRFDSVDGNDDYRLILHIATTNASAWDMFVDTVRVGPKQPGSIRSTVHVDTGLGRGSSGTRVRTFSNSVKETGSAITYTADTTNGDTFTINEDGVYGISYSDRRNAVGASVVGISLNASSTSTDFSSLASEEAIAIDFGSAGEGGLAFVNYPLVEGDVLRAHDNGVNDNATNLVKFVVTKVSD